MQRDADGRANFPSEFVCGVPCPHLAFAQGRNAAFAKTAKSFRLLRVQTRGLKIEEHA